MFNFSLLKQFSRLALNPASKLNTLQQITSRHISTTSAVQFKITDQLWAEPLKKKKKMDPAIVKAREDRRRKKIEKQIRRLEKNARQLKPIDELEIPLGIIDQMHKRKRPPVQLTTEEVEARALLQKDWTRFKRQEYMSNVAQIDRIMSAQRRALDRLYEESEDLYNEAIMDTANILPNEGRDGPNIETSIPSNGRRQRGREIDASNSPTLTNLYSLNEVAPDLQLIPYTIEGPVETPPIKNYESPDGEYIDVSKNWND